MRGIRVDDAGYFATPEPNLPWLTPEIRADFAGADGNEFGSESRRAKIAALHSSSALAVNIFGYWKHKDPSALAVALGLTGGIASIHFERKYTTGIGSRSPNIDIVLHRPSGGVLAVESKFCEPFSLAPNKAIQGKYFPADRGVWTAAGLPGAQRAADAVRNGNPLRYVDSPQLLKHMLGLARSGEDWALLLLWYVPTDLRTTMEAEAEEFGRMLGADAHRFTCMSYQALWRSMRPDLDDRHREYAEYVQARYFAPVV
jgi:hypothetical protein